jgi:polysaccharide biosynthesis/export protein
MARQRRRRGAGREECGARAGAPVHNDRTVGYTSRRRIPLGWSMKQNKPSRRGFAALLLGAVAGGCSHASEPVAGDAPVLEASDYRLGAGDQLRITVYNEADLTGQFVVSSNGTIAYPLLGEVHAAGLTLSELTKSLREALQQGYVRQPNVAVQVLNYRPYFILGEVRTPGTYPYQANLTVLNAVATAQGFTTRAETDWVYIQHADDQTERRYRLTATTPVQPGDTIRIGERLF